MGCTQSESTSPEPVIETLPVVTIYQPKREVYLDKIQMETELLALRRNASEVISENEMIKTQMDIFQSNANPQIFENAQEVSELVSDWQELDLRDGDSLLTALMRIYPKSVEEGQKLQSESFKIRNKDSNLKEYLAYFRKRFQLFNNSWEDILSVWREIEEHATGVKGDLAAKIQEVEGFLGKRTPELEAVQTEFRRLLKLDTTAFLTQQRPLHLQLLDYSTKMHKKRHSDVDYERRRQVSILETDLNTVRSDYSKELGANATKVAAAEAILRSNLESKYEAIIEECKAREKELRTMIEMSGEDHLADIVRTHEEWKVVEKEFREEIDSRIAELKQVKQTNKQEKITNAMQVQKEINQLKRERDQKIKEMQKSVLAYKDEIQRMNHQYAEDRTELQEKHFAELKNRDVLLTELREEFLNKLDSQKSFYEDKMAEDRQKYHTELQEAEDKIKALMQEITLKITLQRGFERSGANDLEKQVIKLTQEKQEMEMKANRTVSELESRLRIMEIETNRGQTTVDNQEELDAMRNSFENELQKVRSEEREKSRRAEEAVMALEKEKALIKMELEGQHLDALRKVQERYGKSMQEMEALFRREKTALLEKAQRDNEEIRKLQGQVRDLNGKLNEMNKKLTEENGQIRSKLELESFRNKKTSEFLKEKETELRVYQREGESFKTQLAKAVSANLEKDTLISDLKTQIFNSNKRLGDLEVYCDSLVKQLQSAQLLEQELRQNQATGMSALTPGSPQEEAMKRILEDLGHRDAKIKELADAQRSKELEFLAMEQGRRLKSALAMIKGSMVSLRQQAFMTWKFNHRQQTPAVTPFVSFHRKNFSFPSPVLSDAQEVDLIFSEEKRVMLEKSPLTAILRTLSRSEKPLSPQQTSILLNEVLEVKYERDFATFPLLLKPETLGEFTVSYFTRKFGHEKLAQKTIGQALLCLLAMARENNPYADILEKMFNIGTADPLPAELNLFLEKVRIDFGKFVESFAEKFPERKESFVSNGGVAFLVDVLSYVYDMFEEDQEAGEMVIAQLRPKDVPIESFIIFNISHKIAKTGLNADGVFELMDLNRNSEIDLSEFISSIKSNLSLWISLDDLELGFSKLTNNAKEITRDLFLEKFNFKLYVEKALTEQFTVTKAEFWKVLIDVYNAKERKNAREILALFEGDTLTKVTAEKFRSVAVKLDPEIAPERVELIWRLVEEASQGDVVRKSATKALLKCKIGPYASSAFCKRLYRRLPLCSDRPTSFIRGRECGCTQS